MSSKPIGSYTDVLCSKCGQELGCNFEFDDGYCPEDREFIKEPFSRTTRWEPNLYPNATCPKCPGAERTFETSVLYDAGPRQEPATAFTVRTR